MLLRFAQRGIVGDDILALAEPELRHLAALSGETVNLAVAGPLGPETIAEIETRHVLGTGGWVGRRGVPLHASAFGKVFLACGAMHLPPGELQSFAPRTITDRRTLEAELVRARVTGFVTAVDELEDGLAAVAAPVRDVFGEIVAALAISGPTLRMPDEAPRRPRSSLRRAGDDSRSEARQATCDGRSGMTHDDILKGLYEETLVGNAPAVKELTNDGLAAELSPESMLYDALIPSLEEVGARFERGDYFVPEMLIAARAMQGALDILRPLLVETGVQQVGTFVMGTVKGDVHDIGKNLVNIMLEGAGFTVIDLGVNVPPEKFVEQILEHKPEIVGFSAFLTTTMPMFKANINALQKAGLRDKVIVMVGGAPVTQEYADAVGADGYAADASTAVRKAKELIEKRRSENLVPA